MHSNSASCEIIQYNTQVMQYLLTTVHVYAFVSNKIPFNSIFLKIMTSNSIGFNLYGHVQVYNMIMCTSYIRGINFYDYFVFFIFIFFISYTFCIAWNYCWENYCLMIIKQCHNNSGKMKFTLSGVYLQNNQFPIGTRDLLTESRIQTYFISASVVLAISYITYYYSL